MKFLFFFGTTQVGERWKTVTELATFAASATTWTADAPVPTTPTRLPSSETSSRQRDVWNAMPGKEAMSMPGGISGMLREPTQEMTMSNTASRPSAKPTV